MKSSVLGKGEFMAPVPPVEVSNVVRGNTWQGCCAKIEADDDARVVFSTRTNEFKTKNRTYSLFNNIQCCVFGETREERENRITQQKVQEIFLDPDKLNWEKVKQDLGLVLEETDPITESIRDRIKNYVEVYRMSLEERPENRDDATSRIMSAPTLDSHAAQAPSKTIQHAVEESGVFKKQSLDKISPTPAVLKASEKSSKRYRPSPESRDLSKDTRGKKGREINIRSNSVPKVSNWEAIDVARRQTDLDLEKSITRRFIEEVARHYSDEQVGPVDVEKVVRDFQDFVQQKEEEKRLYEEKVRKFEIIDEAVRRMIESRGGVAPLSHRTRRELIKKVLEADEELEVMYQEMRGQTPVHQEEEAWLDHKIEDEATISKDLRNYLGCSEDLSKEHETKVRVAQKVAKKISGKLYRAEGPVTPEKILRALEDAAEDMSSESPGKEEEIVEMVVDSGY